ncbi:glutathione S-transferase [Palleronia aestuarii]|uniref:Glutathione S-transferase n=1 Tax=Palleronia aestuarii TaxID=568105 RepID=A0A2W7N4P0_9RHOB|nr:glutathione S-transferase [Palleronia aestuarii]PZX15041.1 glutathione S-transferase [Palleronia aestuarii]
MPDYALYYWPVPFRGQFVRAVLAHADRSWEEPDPEAILGVMEAAPHDQSVPFMAPPMLVDHAENLALAQMPAILLYLGETLDLMPDDAHRRGLTGKIVGDANDVLDEMTRNGGRSMWDTESWNAYLPRLERWMTIWEETGRRHGLSGEEGHLLGGDRTDLADLVTAVLWFTMTEKLPSLGPRLRDHAPCVAALSARVMETPRLSAMRADTDARFGDAWCGGQIEASLRRVIGDA